MSGGPLSIEVDAAACDAHGICALCCPSRVTLDEWGFALVDPEPIVDAATLRRARRAVAACPNRALRLRPVEPAPSASGPVLADGGR